MTSAECIRKLTEMVSATAYMGSDAGAEVIAKLSHMETAEVLCVATGLLLKFAEAWGSDNGRTREEVLAAMGRASFQFEEKSP